MVAAWASLEIVMSNTGDEARFRGVQARFAQQLVDAHTFVEEIIGYYEKLSGLKR